MMAIAKGDPRNTTHMQLVTLGTRVRLFVRMTQFPHISGFDKTFDKSRGHFVFTFLLTQRCIVVKLHVQGTTDIDIVIEKLYFQLLSCINL